MVRLLLEIDFPILPSCFDLIAVPNPITGQTPHNFFGKVIVNGTAFFIDYCDKSDLWWVNPRPVTNFYEILYTKCFYKSPLPEQFGYANYEVDVCRRKEKALLNWNDIESNIYLHKKMKLLEIGCASGEFLMEARNRGWKTLVGVEVDREMVNVAKNLGIHVFEGFFEELDFLDEKFDLIFADNVIEHVLYPLNDLKKCNSLQLVSSLLVLRLPETQSYGPTLKLIDHTYHFTRRSITNILKMAGYTTEKIFYSGTFYGTNYPNKNNDKIINMTVIARKSIDIL